MNDEQTADLKRWLENVVNLLAAELSAENAWLREQLAIALTEGLAECERLRAEDERVGELLAKQHASAVYYQGEYSALRSRITLYEAVVKAATRLRNVREREQIESDVDREEDAAFMELFAAVDAFEKVSKA